MNNAGMSLDALLKASEDEEIDLPGMKESAEGYASLNAQIPASVMRDLRVIAAYTDTHIKEIVAREMTRFARRAKKKMLEEMSAK